MAFRPESRFPSRVTLNAVVDTDAVRARRKRRHAVGDHGLCRPERCPAAGTVGTVVDLRTSSVTVPESVTALRDAIVDEVADQDPTVRALAIRLAELTATSSPAGVAAARALAELVSALRAS